MGKTKKDPNAPKRPQSAYFLWLNANRALIKEENPGISITEISKKAGKMWGEMTAADKVEWDAKAKVAKADYLVAVEEYKKNKVDSDSEEDRPRKKSARN